MNRNSYEGKKSPLDPEQDFVLIHLLERGFNCSLRSDLMSGLFPLRRFISFPLSLYEILDPEVCSADSLAESTSKETTLPSRDRVGTVHDWTVCSDGDRAVNALSPRVRKECQTPA